MKNPEVGNFVTAKSAIPQFDINKGDIGYITWVAEDDSNEVKVDFSIFDGTGQHITVLAKEVKFLGRWLHAKPVLKLMLLETVFVRLKPKGKLVAVEIVGLTYNDPTVTVEGETEDGDAIEFDLVEDDTVVVDR